MQNIPNVITTPSVVTKHNYTTLQNEYQDYQNKNSVLQQVIVHPTELLPVLPIMDERKEDPPEPNSTLMSNYIFIVKIYVYNNIKYVLLILFIKNNVLFYYFYFRQ